MGPAAPACLIPSLAVGLAVLALSGCGTRSPASSDSPGPLPTRLPSDYLPLPTGRDPRYRLPALSTPVRHRSPVAGLSCEPGRTRGFGVHLEIYAHRLVVPLPAGIGIAPPLRRRSVYVLGGACAYPVRTLEPTGVIVVGPGTSLTLSDLFAMWSQPLSGHRLAGFTGTVAAYVHGRRWSKPPGLIRLRPHAEIVLEVDGFVPPHPTYLFAPGL